MAEEEVRESPRVKRTWKLCFWFEDERSHVRSKSGPSEKSKVHSGHPEGRGDLIVEHVKPEQA